MKIIAEIPTNANRHGALRNHLVDFGIIATFHFVNVVNYICDFFKSNCTLDQINDETTKWVLNEIENKTLALTLSANLTAQQPVLPTLRLPNMRFTNTGSCLEMEYRSKGIRLDISTAKQNLTSLKNSIKWMPTKVNIDYSSDGYQV
uniref:Uncharacterized protein n=1 Tax=Magallana gigas TaxID=29159 RepID=K1PJ32_MAGGI